MKLINKLKAFENQYAYVKWAMGGEYGKIKYVGEDYIEFDIVDVDIPDTYKVIKQKKYGEKNITFLNFMLK